MEPLERDESLQVLESALVAHLGISEGDQPYVTPMSFVMIDDKLVFRTMAGRKLDALRQNPKVCVEVSRFDAETGDWESVIIQGTAAEVADEGIKSMTVSKLFRKYDSIMGSPLSTGGGLQPMAGLPYVISVEIEEMTGMTSGRRWAARTRPGRL